MSEYQGVNKMRLRQNRLGTAIKRELSNIIRQELGDKRLRPVTIIKVELTSDLKQARIYFSVLGTDADCKKAAKAIKKATGFIRHLLSQRLDIRFVPEIEFKLSDLSESFRLEEILNEISSQ